MVERIIQAGWHGSGLWDKSLQRPNIKKPLNNPLVFREPATIQPKTPLRVAQSPTLLLTPRKGSDVQKYTHKVMKYTPLSDLPTNRLLFRKIGKSIDSQNTQIALLQQENLALKATIEAIRPHRRRRVHIDPNKLFANIKHIMELRAIVESQPEVYNSYVYEDMCHEWSIYDS